MQISLSSQIEFSNSSFRQGIYSLAIENKIAS